MIFEIDSKKNGEKRILKVLSKKYYHKPLHHKISSLKEHSLLLSLEIFFDSHYAYLVYPHYNILSDTILTNSISYYHIRQFLNDIGCAILALHEQNIFHNDITFRNIFIDNQNHFYLGDFSSAEFCPTTLHFLYYQRKYQRTGSTEFSSPPDTNIFLSVPYYHDVYSFAFLLFMLLHGDIPTENYLSEYEYLKDIDDILLCTLYPSTKNSITMEILLNDLKRAFEQCESRLQKCSFSFSDISTAVLKEDTLDIFSAQDNISGRDLLQKWKNSISIPVPIYGLLFLCSCIFLLSLYHMLTHNRNQTQSHINETTFYSVTTTPSTICKNTTTPATLPPNSFSNYSAHNTLDISDCSYKNNAFLSSVKNAKQITILFAGNNSFQDTKAFSDMTNLEELYLNDNSIHSLSKLSKLINLKILNLSNNKLQNISSLKKLTSLTTLDLSHNLHLTEVQAISSLTKLQYLILTNTNVTQKEVKALQSKLPLCTILY